MANNFVNYAVQGLSIGLDNTIPTDINKYTLVTNENGYATLTGLKSGIYNVQISYSNPEKGYVADTVIVQVEVK